MQTYAARIVIALLMFWVGSRYIWNDRMTPPAEPQLLDFAPLCMFLAWAVMAASFLLLMYSSSGYLIALIDRAKRDDAPRMSRMKIGLLVALVVAAWGALPFLVWEHLARPPYARFEPEPAAVIPVGETRTYKVASNIPGLVVHAELAYRPEGKCATGDTEINVSGGDRVTIEACRPGVGAIRMTGYGVDLSYQLGASTEGRVLGYYVDFLDEGRVRQTQKLQFDTGFWLPGGVRGGWDVPLAQGTLRIKALDWTPRPRGPVPAGPLVIVRDDGPTQLSDYFIDVYGNDNSLLVRLDFADSGHAVPEEAGSLIFNYGDGDLIYYWKACEVPEVWSRGVAATFMEKTPDYQPPPPPAC